MVVDGRVPAAYMLVLCIRVLLLTNGVAGQGANLQEGLVSVSPEEVLGAEVLVRVLSALLKWLHVGPVLPVLVPENVGVGGSNDQSWDNSAKNGQHTSLHPVSRFHPPIGVPPSSRLPLSFNSSSRFVPNSDSVWCAGVTY